MARHPTARNNDRFLSTIDGRDFTLHRRAIVGTDRFPLHAPKRLAIFGDVFYIADLDAIAAYDLVGRR